MPNDSIKVFVPPVETKETPYGTGTVISIDILNRRYKVVVSDEVKEIYLDEKGS